MRVATDKLTAKYKNCMKTKLVIIPPLHTLCQIFWGKCVVKFANQQATHGHFIYQF